MSGVFILAMTVTMSLVHVHGHGHVKSADEDEAKAWRYLAVDIHKRRWLTSTDGQEQSLGERQKSKGSSQLPQSPNQICCNCPSCITGDLSFSARYKTRVDIGMVIAGVNCIRICKTDSHNFRLRRVMLTMK